MTPPAAVPARLGPGLLLAAVATFTWALVPLGQAVAMTGVDGATLTWVRFTVAVLVMGAWFWQAGTLPAWRAVRPVARSLLLAGAALALNYFLYAQSLLYLSPQAVAMLSAMLPLWFLFVVVLLLRERMSAVQWAGAALLSVGLALFFGRRWQGLLLIGTRDAMGLLLIVFGNVAWIAYGLVQRRLGAHLGSQQTLWLVFCGASLAVLPFARPLIVVSIAPAAALAVLVLCACTVIAYGAFSAAMARIGSARVSALTAVAPLVTLSLAPWLAGLPTTVAEPLPLSIVQWCAAGVVVLGSAMCALGGRATAESPP